MIPEIGQFALTLALALAICQGVLPLIGAHRNDAVMMGVAKTAATGQFVFVAIAFFRSCTLPIIRSCLYRRSTKCLQSGERMKARC